MTRKSPNNKKNENVTKMGCGDRGPGDILSFNLVWFEYLNSAGLCDAAAVYSQKAVYFHDGFAALANSGAKAARRRRRRRRMVAAPRCCCHPANSCMVTLCRHENHSQLTTLQHRIPAHLTFAACALAAPSGSLSYIHARSANRASCRHLRLLKRSSMRPAAQ